MKLTLQIALIAITLIYIYLILRSVRNKKMNPSFSIFWLFSGVILIIFAIFPQLIEWVAYELGFATPSNLLFCISIFMAFYLIFSLTIAVSKENQKNITMVQEISLLKEKINQLQEKLNKVEEEENSQDHSSDLK